MRLLFGRAWREKLWMSKRDKADLAGRIAMASAKVLSHEFQLHPIKIQTSGSNPSVNPSLIKTDSGYLMIARSSRLRCYNDVDYVENGAGIDDVNFLYTLDESFNVIQCSALDERLLKDNGHCIKHCMSDTRLLYWQGKLWGIGAAAQKDQQDEVVKQVLFCIEGSTVSQSISLDSPTGYSLEKNWTPVIYQQDLKLIYSFSPLNILRIENNQAIPERKLRKVRHHDARGGTQLIEYNGGYLGLVHQAPNMWNGKRSYTHSFVWFNQDLELLEISEPFYLQRKGLEFAAGICQIKGGIVVSYGVGDRACMVMKIPHQVIERYLCL